MLAKEYRLPGRTRFLHPRISKTSYFLLRTQKNQLAVSRFGFVVAKRVDKRAVVRNRIKRVFRSYIESRKQTIASGYDFLFILSPQINSAIPTDVEQSLVKTLQQLQLLTPAS